MLPTLCCCVQTCCADGCVHIPLVRLCYVLGSWLQAVWIDHGCTWKVRKVMKQHEFPAGGPDDDLGCHTSGAILTGIRTYYSVDWDRAGEERSSWCRNILTPTHQVPRKQQETMMLPRTSGEEIVALKA